jgi:hypothetical protein
MLAKVQVAVAADSLLPRDRIVNTFHLNNDGGLFTDEDWAGIAEDTATLFSTLYTGTREINVRVYDARGAAPHFPKGQFTRNVGTQNPSNSPREVACCLSYYGERNLPHTRGRMYICSTVAAMSGGPRPVIGDANKLFDLADGIAGLGGLDVDWQVYSPTTDAAENVQHCWVDDEWDTIRSRGLRGAARWTHPISE